MNIAGIGIVYTRGRGIGCFDSALQEGWVSPSFINHSSVKDGVLPVYTVQKENLKDKEISVKIRRADKFTKCPVPQFSEVSWEEVATNNIMLLAEEMQRLKH